MVSAFALVSRQAGGVILFQVVNFTLLVANLGSGMGAQLAAGRLLYGMGRGNALPKSFFGVIEPKRRIPRNNIVAVGGFALLGAALLQFFADRLGGGAYEIGAECLNFGAFVAFMGVNAAAFVHHWRNERKRSRGGLIVPGLGFLICGFIWAHLSIPALILGAVWMVAGIASARCVPVAFNPSLSLSMSHRMPLRGGHQPHKNSNVCLRFHNCLGEVSRPVDIDAMSQSHEVGEHLQRNHFRYGEQIFRLRFYEYAIAD